MLVTTGFLCDKWLGEPRTWVNGNLRSCADPAVLLGATGQQQWPSVIPERGVPVYTCCLPHLWRSKSGCPLLGRCGQQTCRAGLLQRDQGPSNSSEGHQWCQPVFSRVPQFHYLLGLYCYLASSYFLWRQSFNTGIIFTYHVPDIPDIYWCSRSFWCFCTST